MLHSGPASLFLDEQLTRPGTYGERMVVERAR